LHCRFLFRFLNILTFSLFAFGISILSFHENVTFFSSWIEHLACFFLSLISLTFLWQARKSRITELWHYHPRFSRIRTLPSCHGSNDGRIKLFSRKSKIEVFRSFSSCLSFSLSLSLFLFLIFGNISWRRKRAWGLTVSEIYT